MWPFLHAAARHSCSRSCDARNTHHSRAKSPNGRLRHRPGARRCPVSSRDDDPRRPRSHPAPQLQRGPDPFLTNHRTLALFLISVVGLFLELLLIRWISTEIRIFAYLQNTVLVVCFLGVGDGVLGLPEAVRAAGHAGAARHLVRPAGHPTTRVILGSITATMLGAFGDL